MGMAAVAFLLSLTTVSMRGRGALSLSPVPTH